MWPFKKKKPKIICLHTHWEIKPKTSMFCVDCLDCKTTISFGELFRDTPFITSEIFDKLKKL